MRLGVDIDEVLIPFIQPFLAYYNHVRGTSFTCADITHHSLAEALSIPKEDEYDLVHRFCKTTAFYELAPFLEAQTAIAQLRQRYHLSIITARPEQLKTHTQAWLHAHFGDAFSALHFTHEIFSIDGEGKTKGGVCLSEGIDILVDDSLNHALDCAPATCAIYLMNKPWNQTSTLPANVHRVDSWKEIVACLL